MPVDTSHLFASRDEARAVARKPIALSFCCNCGHIYNRDFDASSVVYDSAYENSQMFSPTFKRYALDLIERLAATYALDHASVVELGGGRGDFLRLLCEATASHGTSFDPSYTPTEAETRDPSVTFVPEMYSDRHARTKADFVLCRHVLEHLERPEELLASLRTIAKEPDSGVYVEVPNAAFILREAASWEIIYTHCSYFTEQSLVGLLRRSGLGVHECVESFGTQFLSVDARRDDAGETQVVDPTVMLTLDALASSFAIACKAKITAWRGELSARLAAGKRVVLWGAGAKSVAFLNELEVGAGIDYVVDLNPRKTGTYIPGTGQQIVSPQFLSEVQPDTVIILNKNYQREIVEAANRYGAPQEYLLA